MIDTSKKGKKEKAKKYLIHPRHKKCEQYGDPNFVCFRINELEFFSDAKNFS